MQKSYSSPVQLRLVLLISLLVVARLAHAQPAVWEIDPEHFSIAFEAGHIGYQKQLGLFLEGSGNFRYDPTTFEFTAGRVEIQAASIFTNLIARDNHLRGRDFLNTRRNPLIIFEAAEYVPGSQAAPGTLAGNLTLLGETHPIVLRVTINKQAKYPFGHRLETIGISAQTIISRSKWGMDYGVAGSLVGDEVTLRFEFEALRQ